MPRDVIPDPEREPDPDRLAAELLADPVVREALLVLIGRAISQALDAEAAS